jgi:uncharacterized membrane protein AbrB (regulator of aidB expression)
LFVITAGFALGLSLTTDVSAVTVLLSFSPGGFTEMGIIAITLGIDTAFVAFHHLVRVAFVGMLGGVLFRTAAKRRSQSNQ